MTVKQGQGLNFAAAYAQSWDSRPCLADDAPAAQLSRRLPDRFLSFSFLSWEPRGFAGSSTILDQAVGCSISTAVSSLLAPTLATYSHCNSVVGRSTMCLSLPSGLGVGLPASEIQSLVWETRPSWKWHQPASCAKSNTLPLVLILAPETVNFVKMKTVWRAIVLAVAGPEENDSRRSIKERVQQTASDIPFSSKFLQEVPKSNYKSHCLSLLAYQKLEKMTFHLSKRMTVSVMVLAGKSKSSSKSTRVHQQHIVSLLATWLDKGWGNPDQNVVAQTLKCCWWMCGFAWRMTVVFVSIKATWTVVQQTRCITLPTIVVDCTTLGLHFGRIEQPCSHGNGAHPSLDPGRMRTRAMMSVAIFLSRLPGYLFLMSNQALSHCTWPRGRGLCHQHSLALEKT